MSASTPACLHHGHTASSLAARLLTTISSSIIPLTTPAVARGCKVFGASILSKSTLSPIVSATNDELASPLYHGEVATLLAFHSHNNALAACGQPRIDPKDCVFLSTHEPCSLCLSAITWSGFDNFYYLFTYKDTMQAFSIPHDISILQEVFQTSPPTLDETATREGRGLYNRKNKYWECFSLQDLIDQSDTQEKEALSQRMEDVKREYSGLSEAYQQSKAGQVGQIPLA